MVTKSTRELAADRPHEPELAPFATSSFRTYRRTRIPLHEGLQPIFNVFRSDDLLSIALRWKVQDPLVRCPVQLPVEFPAMI